MSNLKLNIYDCLDGGVNIDHIYKAFFKGWLYIDFPYEEHLHRLPWLAEDFKTSLDKYYTMLKLRRDGNARPQYEIDECRKYWISDWRGIRDSASGHPHIFLSVYVTRSTRYRFLKMIKENQND